MRTGIKSSPIDATHSGRAAKMERKRIDVPGKNRTCARGFRNAVPRAQKQA